MNALYAGIFDQERMVEMNWNIKKKLIAASLVGSVLIGQGIGTAYAYASQDTQSVIGNDTNETVQRFKDAYALQ